MIFYLAIKIINYLNSIKNYKIMFSKEISAV